MRGALLGEMSLKGQSLRLSLYAPHPASPFYASAYFTHVMGYSSATPLHSSAFVPAGTSFSEMSGNKKAI